MSSRPVLFESLPPVLTPRQMQAADAATISSIGIGGFTLMEVAGRKVADAAARYFGEKPGRVICFCGTGNNGGDGFVASRVLLEKGAAVIVVLAGDEDNIAGDARKHFEILKKAGDGNNSFSLSQAREKRAGNWQSDVVIDALVGTGLKNSVRGEIKLCIQQINQSGVPVIAVDIPSGLSGVTGKILGEAVHARETVVMAALKRGLIIGDGPSCAAVLDVAEIGIPTSVLMNSQTSGVSVRLMTRSYFTSRRIERNRKSNKYTSGPLFVIAGSPDYTGAPVLAATAAARSGSGYVRCICPPSIHALLKEKLTEIPVTSWANGTGGENMTDGAPDAMATRSEIGDHFEKCRAFLVGPGLGRSPEMTTFVKSLLELIADTYHNRAILDADGIMALSGWKEKVKTLSRGRWILTPHAGEARILDQNKSREEPAEREDVIEKVVRLAKDWNCVVLLKGFPSVTAAPDGRVMVNNSVIAASATAGTGDVLAGIVAGLAAQGLDAFDAAVCGVYRASSLAEEYVSSHTAESMMASDLLSLMMEKN